MLVIVGVAMVALVAMVGLIIDGGFAWSQNRAAQNGVDAAAHAGASAILEDHLGEPKTDGDVWAEMEDIATENGVILESAEYTRWDGTPLGIPVTAGGAGPIPDDAQGVRAVGTRAHETFFMQVVGIGDVTVRNDATSVTGPVPNPAALLPVTFPLTETYCDEQNKAVVTEDPWEQDERYIFPLCGSATGVAGGSYGWIDWYDSGGAPDVWEQVCSPNPPAIDLPGWYEVVQDGNISAGNLEDCFNDNWAGKIIQIPLFDVKCKNKPEEGMECLDPGNADWYHFYGYALIRLEWAYINGNYDECEYAGATRCLIGSFVDGAIQGPVGGPWDPNDSEIPSSAYAIQLMD